MYGFQVMLAGMDTTSGLPGNMLVICWARLFP
jgi:hypothetical protein